MLYLKLLQVAKFGTEYVVLFRRVVENEQTHADVYFHVRIQRLFAQVCNLRYVVFVLLEMTVNHFIYYMYLIHRSLRVIKKYKKIERTNSFSILVLLDEFLMLLAF